MRDFFPSMDSLNPLATVSRAGAGRRQAPTAGCPRCVSVRDSRVLELLSSQVPYQGPGFEAECLVTGHGKWWLNSLTTIPTSRWFLMLIVQMCIQFVSILKS